MKCSIPSSLCPHRQLAGQEIDCSWSQGHNSQDAWNMQDLHSHSRQPPCYWPQIQNCQCCQQMEPKTSVSPPTTATGNIKTPEPICMQELHKSHTPDRTSCPAKDPTCPFLAKFVIGMQDIKAPLVDRRIQTRSHPDVDTLVENKSRPTLLM